VFCREAVIGLWLPAHGLSIKQPLTLMDTLPLAGCHLAAATVGLAANPLGTMGSRRWNSAPLDPLERMS
jgi:hypothetical protein